MDPLSICAGVIAVIQATNEVIVLCYNYRAALRDQPWALSQILGEVQDLRSTLEEVETIALKAKKTESGQEQFVTAFAGANNGPLLRCEEELAKLQALLAPSRLAGAPGTHRNAAITVFTWRVKDKEATASLDRIGRIKTTLNLALSAANATILLDVKELATDNNRKLRTLNSDVQSLQTHLREDRSLMEESRRQQLLQKLCPSDPVKWRHTTTQACVESTTAWLFDTAPVQSFSAGKLPGLWISGGPGTGKTMLFASIVSQLEQHSDRKLEELVAHFYYDFRNRKACQPESAAISLVGQLCKATGIVPAQLEKALQGTDAGDLTDRLDLGLLESLIHFFAEQYNIILLVDALDECQDNSRLAAFLNKISSHKVRIIVTSRELPVFAEELTALTQLRLSDYIEQTGAAIQQYLEARLTDDKRLRALGEDVKLEITTSLQYKASGMFRWVQCQLDTLAGLRTVKQIKQALAALPKGLDETYAHILRRVASDDQEFVRRTLVWLSFAMLPLSLSELHEAVAIDMDSDDIDDDNRLSNIQDICTLCGSLISVNGSGMVTLAHMSVKDYLLSDTIRNDSTTSLYALTKQQASLELAKTCMAYLRFAEFQQGPAQSAEAFADRLQRYPLTRHTTFAWPYHLRNAGTHTDYFRNFFQPEQRAAFMSWVQVINADCGFKWNIYPACTTSLYYAASFGLETLVEELINAGADVNAPASRLKGTALHGAIFRREEATVRILIAAGADVNKADCLRTTPLHVAVSGRNMRMIHLLLEHGALPQLEDVKGRSAIDWSRLAQAAHITELLEKSVGQYAEVPDKDRKALPSVFGESLHVWKNPNSGLFEFFDDRSGMESSIVVKVETVKLPLRQMLSA